MIALLVQGIFVGWSSLLSLALKHCDNPKKLASALQSLSVK